MPAAWKPEDYENDAAAVLHHPAPTAQTAGEPATADTNTMSTDKSYCFQAGILLVCDYFLFFYLSVIRIFSITC